jgi:predicted DNA-binding transcriptional regulator AlpA
MTKVSAHTALRARLDIPACMRPREAAKYLSLSQSTLDKWRAMGKGPTCVQLGSKAVAYRRADLDGWLESRLRGSTTT